MESFIDHARLLRAYAAVHGMTLNPAGEAAGPRALFVSCSDARLVPALLTGALPGELIEVRNVGGIVPRYRPQSPCGEAATIEYAVQTANVTDIVVCGHSRCEAVETATEAGTEEASPFLTAWWRQGQPAPAPKGPAAAPPSSGDLTAAGHCHVLRQVDTLSDYPCVAPLLAERKLHIHAWYYEVDTGAVLEHRPWANAFLPL